MIYCDLHFQTSGTVHAHAHTHTCTHIHTHVHTHLYRTVKFFLDKENKEKRCDKFAGRNIFELLNIKHLSSINIIKILNENDF